GLLRRRGTGQPAEEVTRICIDPDNSRRAGPAGSRPVAGRIGRARRGTAIRAMIDGSVRYRLAEPFGALASPHCRHRVDRCVVLLRDAGQFAVTPEET